jgi:hypothetical protein
VPAFLGLNVRSCRPASRSTSTRRRHATHSAAHATTPLALFSNFQRAPKVGALLQPWAEGHNPFGIAHLRAIRESQRDSVPKPRVARHELPWVTVRKSFPTATRLRPFRFVHRAHSATTTLWLFPILPVYPT